jgi:uncharacterized protein YjiS (DUF1127 family)
MLPTNRLHHRFAAGFLPADDGSRPGLPFPLSASWPVPPLREPSLSVIGDRQPIAVELRRVLHDLRRDGLAGTLKTWAQRIRYRRDLRRLMVAAPHLVDDIGLTCGQASAEASRPFWC